MTDQTMPAPVPQQAMCLCAALRQAAIDMPRLADGATVSARVREWGGLFVAHAQVHDAHRVLLWEEFYGRDGRRIARHEAVNA